MAPPCDWDVDPTALGVCSTWAERTELVRTAALDLATLYLWGATGRRFGVCPVSVRSSQGRGVEVLYQDFAVMPGAQGLGVPGGPFLFAGRWFNAGCATACCGSSACAVVLRGPVASVDEVLVGEEIIPPSAYRVDITGGAWLLVRTDGECWPVCQNFTADEGEEGAFVVTYGFGTAPPRSLLVAAAQLACEFASGLTGGPCKLPSKMTQLTRQGVTVELEAPEAGEKTGIREVDMIVAALNPTGRLAPPVLYSPDLPESCDRMTVIGAGS